MSAELALKLIETNEVETKALSIVDESKNIQVIDSETYIKAGKMWQDLGAMLKEIDACLTPFKRMSTVSNSGSSPSR